MSEWITMGEASEMVGVSLPTMRRLVSLDALDVFRLGARYLVREEDIEELIVRRTGPLDKRD